MIPAAFDYVRAGSIDDALAALASTEVDAKLLAGGDSKNQGVAPAAEQGSRN